MFATSIIQKGLPILEYTGERINKRQMLTRSKSYEKENLGDYIFDVDGKVFIDATRTDGDARFVNHSCNPNCISRTVSIDQTPSVILYASREIKEGEELTLDYHMKEWNRRAPRLKCFCQSTNCRIFLT